MWVGWSDGDLWMINLFTGQVLERRVSAHSHPILHILRSGTELWTLDENGVLQVWNEPKPDQSGKICAFPVMAS
jgi:hypothetical protein